MTNYFVSERYPAARYTAGVLREDIETVLAQEGFTKLTIPEPSGLLNRILFYIKAPAAFRRVKDPGYVFFHFPLRSRLIRSFLETVINKGGTPIAYVHDFEGLRDQEPGLLQEEMKLLSQFPIVIAQNEAMKQVIDEHTNTKKIIVLGMYDYLGVDNNIPQRSFSPHICFAGNLAKASFVQQLHTFPCLQFSIYGQGAGATNAANVSFKGVTDPRELPHKLEGSFGLVWDGDSISSAQGAGAYLQYNIPHKLALYIMAGTPVLVWDQSAMAGWVRQEGIGLTISTLSEIKQAISQLSEDDYQQMRSNMVATRKKMSEGKFLSEALKRAVREEV